MPDLDAHFRSLSTVRTPEQPPDFRNRPLRPMPPPPRRPQRVLAIAVALLVAAGGIFAISRAFDQGGPQHPTGYGDTPPASPEPSPLKSPGSSEPSSEPTPMKSPASEPSPAPDWAQGGVFGAMYDTIASGSPAGWSFDLTQDRLDGDWRIDGNVDDGAGPGRLFVDVTTRAGNLQADPCSDPQFALGSPCETQHLGNGDTLVLRDVHTDPGGTKTIEVVLIHPDRSEITAEAANFQAPELPPGPVSQSPSSAQITRDDPPYEVGQLGKIMMAVDQAVQECLSTNC